MTCFIFSLSSRENKNLTDLIQELLSDIDYDTYTRADKNLCGKTQKKLLTASPRPTCTS